VAFSRYLGLLRVEQMCEELEEDVFKACYFMQLYTPLNLSRPKISFLCYTIGLRYLTTLKTQNASKWDLIS